MSSLESFLEMGGYGGFVWPAFAVTAAVLLALLVDSLRRLRNDQRALARLESRSGQGRGRHPGDAAGGPRPR